MRRVQDMIILDEETLWCDNHHHLHFDVRLEPRETLNPRVEAKS